MDGGPVAAEVVGVHGRSRRGARVRGAQGGAAQAGVRRRGAGHGAMESEARHGEHQEHAGAGAGSAQGCREAVREGGSSQPLAQDAQERRLRHLRHARRFRGQTVAGKSVNLLPRALKRKTCS